MSFFRNRSAATAIGGLVGIAVLSLFAHFARWPGFFLQGQGRVYWQNSMTLVFGILWVLLSLHHNIARRWVPLLAYSLSAVWLSCLAALLASEYLSIGDLHRAFIPWKREPRWMFIDIGFGPIITGAWAYAVAAIVGAKCLLWLRGIARPT